MIEPGKSLLDMINCGELGPGHGAVFTVHANVILSEAVQWAIQNLGFRLPSGTSEPPNCTQYVYFGPVGVLPTRVMFTYSESCAGHISLRSRTEQGFEDAKDWLQKNGFVVLKAYERMEVRTRSTMLSSRHHRFKISIDWDECVPQDPAIVHGSPSTSLRKVDTDDKKFDVQDLPTLGGPS